MDRVGMSPVRLAPIPVQEFLLLVVNQVRWRDNGWSNPFGMGAGFDLLPVILYRPGCSV